MKVIVWIFSLLFVFSCTDKRGVNTSEAKEIEKRKPESPDFVMVFASCNHQDRPQPLWESILEVAPDMFIWGGDNVYADTDDMVKMKADYDKVKANEIYAQIASRAEIEGTWDDHDYGRNDAGVDWEKKEEAKDILLDFLDVSEDDPRRSRGGVYYSKTITAENGSIKLIVLDTRYFRDQLMISETEGGPYISWPMDHDGTILGEEQWSWLEKELDNDSADFTVIISSIQFLSKVHGWEKWMNFPRETKRMRKMISSARARNIMFLSGDRHLGEISVDTEAGLDYPLVDFTSSGMTHTWIDSATEANEYRVSNVVKRLNFGLISFDFEKKAVTFELRGEDNFIFERYTQQY